MRRRLAALLVVTALLLPSLVVAPVRAATAPAYTIAALPRETAVDINDAGQILLQDRNLTQVPATQGSGRVPAIREPDGRLTELPPPASPPPGGSITYATTGMNNAGTVIGYGRPYATGSGRFPQNGVVWENGIPRELQTPLTNAQTQGHDVFVRPNAINDQGAIVGQATISPILFNQALSDFPMQWQGTGTATLLPRPAQAGPYAPTEPQAINNAGAIVGKTIGGGLNVPITWAGGQVTYLPLPFPDLHSFGVSRLAINNPGLVAGWANYTKNDATTSGAYWYWQGGAVQAQPGRTIICSGYPGEAALTMLDLNDRGQAVGTGNFGCQGGNGTAALYQGGALISLNVLLEGNGWNFTQATAINNHGQIVGNGLLNDVPTAFLLTPTGAPLFGDIPAGDPAAAAIAELNARGIIRGCDIAASPPLFCPGDTTLRAQMAALIVRAMPDWPADDFPNTFTDQGGVDAELWRRVATLQHYGVAGGYNDCPAQGKVAPCYGPTDPVNRAQAISFVTRAMVKKGYWQDQPVDPALYRGGLAGTGHEQDAATYWHYTRAQGGVPDYGEAGAFPTFEAAPRGWFARLLWTALQGSPAAP